jgi:hypothetical protein
MDMTRFLKSYLNVPDLEALGGEYDGVIDSVTDEEIRNRFTGKKSFEPVISFVDGKRLVLNKGMLRMCLKWFGDESTEWIGRRVRVFLRRVESVNRETGESRVRLHRGLMCDDPHAQAPISGRWPVKAVIDAIPDREPGDDDGAVGWEESEGMPPAAEIFRRRHGGR